MKVEYWIMNELELLDNVFSGYQPGCYFLETGNRAKWPKVQVSDK